MVLLFSKRLRMLLFVMVVFAISFVVSLSDANSYVLAPDCDEEKVSDYAMGVNFSKEVFLTDVQKKIVAQDSYIERIKYLDFYSANNSELFKKFLGIYYKSYAFYLYNYLNNFEEAEHFAYKAWLSYMGNVPPVDNMNTRRVSSNYAVDLSLSIDRYLEAFKGEVYFKYPLDMAYAQVSLDCWLERQSNSADYHQVASCQRDFFAKMDSMFQYYDSKEACEKCGNNGVVTETEKVTMKKEVSFAASIPAIPEWDNTGAKKYYGDSSEQLEYKKLVKEMAAMQAQVIVTGNESAKRIELLQEELGVLKRLVKEGEEFCDGTDEACVIPQENNEVNELKVEIEMLKKHMIQKKQEPVTVVVETTPMTIVDKEYQEALTKKVVAEETGDVLQMHFPAEIFFDWDKAALKSQYRFIVKDAAHYVLKNGIESVMVEGHADTSGNKVYNMKLSQKRADAIKNALVSYGVPVERIEAVARGENDLKIPTADGIINSENRRGVIYIEK